MVVASKVEPYVAIDLYFDVCLIAMYRSNRPIFVV